jgi:hypothetical protein
MPKSPFQKIALKIKKRNSIEKNEKEYFFLNDKKRFW